VIDDTSTINFMSYQQSTFNGVVYSDLDDFNTNNPFGIISTEIPTKNQWIFENLTTFDSCSYEVFSDYYKMTIKLKDISFDYAVGFRNRQPQVLTALNTEQLAELNVDDTSNVDYLIKTVEDNDDAPQEGYALKGGGRLSIFNV